MKHRILFSVLLIVITAVGFNGSKITKAILSAGDSEQSKISRSSVNSAAIYLSPDEISFDPMSIVDKDNSKPVSKENNRYYGGGRFDFCGIMDSLIRNISIYSEKTEYAKPVGAEIADSIYAAPNGLYYIEKHPYYNKFNNKRYVDLILDSEDLSIRYINFYDDQQHSVSSDAVQRGIEKLDKMSMEFYSKILNIYNYYNIYGWFYGENYSEINAKFPFFMEICFDPFNEEEQNVPLGYNGVYDLFISNACADTKIANTELNDTDPMSMFFKVSSAPSMVSFWDRFDNDLGEYDGNIEIRDEDPYSTTRCFTSSMKFISECVDSDFIKNAEFSAYNGKIYMTSSLQNNKKIIIYNILTNEIEGFCCFYNNDTW